MMERIILDHVTSGYDVFVLIGAILTVVAPIAGLIWYIIKHPKEWKEIILAGIITLLVIATFLVGGVKAAKMVFGPGTTATSPPHAGVTPTAPLQKTQTTSNSSKQPPQDLYHQVTQGPATLDDPLNTSSANNWTENTGEFSCQFINGAYHAITQQKDSYTLCMAQAPQFGDLAYQVQMTIAKGDFGGMVFRTDSSQTKYYTFYVNRSGTYTLKTSVDKDGTQDELLCQGTSSFIHTGLNQPNLLTVIAQGSTIFLYVNQQYINHANDRHYRAGQIGLFGANTTAAPSDVVFRHVQVWSFWRVL